MHSSLEDKHKDAILWMNGLTPRKRLTAVFKKKWESVLSYYEESAIEEFRQQGLRKDQARKLVQRGWATPNLERQLFEYSVGDGGDDPTFDSVPVVLECSEGNWLPPLLLSLLMKNHPVLQKELKRVDSLSGRERFMLKLEWAIDQGAVDPADPWNVEDLCVEERMLAQSARTLRNLLFPYPDFAPPEWLKQARDIDEFWQILETARDYGRREAFLEVFGDGEVAKRAVAYRPSGKGASAWTTLIRQEIALFHAEKEKVPTAKELLSLLGGTRDPKNDDAPCSFTDARICEIENELGPISWVQFQARVKTAKRGL